MPDMDSKIYIRGSGHLLRLCQDPIGTFLVLTIGREGAYQQVSLNANNRLEHELTVLDGDPRVRNIKGETVIRAPERFRLVIEGDLVPDHEGNALRIETTVSPHGKGKDQCGKEIEGERS